MPGSLLLLKPVPAREEAISWCLLPAISPASLWPGQLVGTVTISPSCPRSPLLALGVLGIERGSSRRRAKLQVTPGHQPAGRAHLKAGWQQAPRLVQGCSLSRAQPQVPHPALLLPRGICLHFPCILIRAREKRQQKDALAKTPSYCQP